MLHNKKISQRRVLLFDHIGGQGFRTMPSTESEPCRPPIPLTPSLVDDMPSEQVADIRRNEWTACFGIAGRHGPDYAMPRPLMTFEELFLLEDLSRYDGFGTYHQRRRRLKACLTDG